MPRRNRRSSRPVRPSEVVSTRDSTARKPVTHDEAQAVKGLVNDSHSVELLKRMATRDSFSNPIARTGFGTPSISEGTEYPLTRLTNNYQLINSLYRNNWIVRNVIDTIPEDMTRNWIRLRSEEPPEQLGKLDRMWRTRRLKHQILHGLKWGRLYGGAAGIMMIEGDEDRLDEPLNLDRVMPGSFKALMVVDRWVGCYPSEEIVDDINDIEFGLPKYYMVKMEDNSDRKIHHTRVVRFMGRQLPYWEQLAEVMWGASEVEIIYEELKKRDNLSWNILNLSYMANLRFMKISGMDQMLTLGDTQSQQDFYNVMQAMNWMMSNGRMQILGENDEFQQFQYSFAGMNEIYQSFMMDVAGASKYPVSKLFGRSPAGMDATGEHDMENYYDTVEQARESQLAPVIDKILPVMCMSELGYVPDDIDYDFNPIQEPTDKEVAELVQQKGGLLNELYNSGLLSQRTVLLELKQMSEATGMFTNITNEDIENADDSTSQGEVIPEDAFSPNQTFGQAMGAETPDRTRLQERNSARDERPGALARFFRRARRNH